MVGERVRPEHAARDRHVHDGRLTRAVPARRAPHTRRAPPPGTPATSSRSPSRYPRRADRDDRSGTDRDDAQVRRKLPRSALPGPPEPHDPGADHDRDQDVGRRRCRADDRGSRRRARSRTPGACSAARRGFRARTRPGTTTPSEASRSPRRSPAPRARRRRRKDAELDRERPTGRRRAEHRGDHRRREEPGGRRAGSRRTRSPHKRLRGAARLERTSAARASRARAPRAARQPGPGELLDTAPERVAEEDRRLSRDEGRECSHRPQRTSGSSSAYSASASIAARNAMYGWKIQARS